jgi:hypothetical protein
LLRPGIGGKSGAKGYIVSAAEFNFEGAVLKKALLKLTCIDF